MPNFSTAIRQAFPDYATDFDVIESQTLAWKHRLADARKSVEHGQARAEGQQQNNVEYLVAITAGGLAIRVWRLAEATTTLINKENPHAAPPVVRALFETCCVPIYWQRQLLPRLEKGRVDQVHELVFRLTLGSIGFYGSDKIKPIKVDSLIRSARAELEEMEAGVPNGKKTVGKLIEVYYGPLTESTHPNWGALSLGTELKIGSAPSFLPAVSFDNRIMDYVAGATSYIMEAGGRAFDAVLLALDAFPMDLPNKGPPEKDAANS